METRDRVDPRTILLKSWENNDYFTPFFFRLENEETYEIERTEQWRLELRFVVDLWRSWCVVHAAPGNARRRLNNRRAFYLTRGITRILSELSPRRSIEIGWRRVANGVGRGCWWLMCVFLLTYVRTFEDKLLEKERDVALACCCTRRNSMLKLRVLWNKINADSSWSLLKSNIRRQLHWYYSC